MNGENHAETYEKMAMTDEGEQFYWCVCVLMQSLIFKSYNRSNQRVEFVGNAIGTTFFNRPKQSQMM
jgi:hypothetical protein